MGEVDMRVLQFSVQDGFSNLLGCFGWFLGVEVLNVMRIPIRIGEGGLEKEENL